MQARKALENALLLDPKCAEALMALVSLDVAEHRLREALDLYDLICRFLVDILCGL